MDQIKYTEIIMNRFQMEGCKPRAQPSKLGVNISPVLKIQKKLLIRNFIRKLLAV
jgi:hypothetical protein